MAKGNFGERLKRERELREVTLEEITSHTRIGPRFLNALENEDWEKLPGGVFNRGFVRAIARYLGLDEEAFLAEYDMAHNANGQQKAPQPEDPIPSPPRWIPFALVLGGLVLLVAIVIGGVYGWRYYRARKSRATAPSTAVVAQPAPTDAQPAAVQSPAPVLPQPSPTLDLVVSTSAPSYLRIAADGNVVFDAAMPAGENHHFFAKDKFQVSASDATAVLLELNGQVMPPLGPRGSSGTMNLSRNDLRQAASGNPKP